MLFLTRLDIGICADRGIYFSGKATIIVTLPNLHEFKIEVAILISLLAHTSLLTSMRWLCWSPHTQQDWGLH